MSSVVLVMATLAQGSEVAWVAVLRLVVEVGHRKHHTNHLLRLLVEEPRMVLPSAELASVVRPFEDGWPNFGLPVLRVSGFVLWSYRHITYVS